MINELCSANVVEAKANDKNKLEAMLEAIRNVLRTYFEVDPWTEEHTELYDDTLTAQDAIDMIVDILK